jgi:hypothetical protein
MTAAVLTGRVAERVERCQHCQVVEFCDWHEYTKTQYHQAFFTRDLFAFFVAWHVFKRRLQIARSQGKLFFGTCTQG